MPAIGSSRGRLSAAAATTCRSKRCRRAASGMLCGALLGGVAGEQSGAVAGVLHGLDQGGGVQQAGDALDGSALGGEVNLGALHARDGGERMLYTAGASGAGHAGYRQLAAVGADVVAGGLDGAGQLGRGGLAAGRSADPPVRRPGSPWRYVRQGVQRRFHAAGAGGAGHAHDRQADMLAAVPGGVRLWRCRRCGDQGVHRCDAL